MLNSVCWSMLTQRVAEFLGQPSWFFLFSHDVYSAYVTSFFSARIVHAFPALLVMSGVRERYIRSEMVEQGTQFLRQKIHWAACIMCHEVLCVFILNLTLVTMLSLQDVVYCLLAANCQQKSLASAVLPWTSDEPTCPTEPTAFDLAVVYFIAVALATTLLWPVIVRSCRSECQQHRRINVTSPVTGLIRALSHLLTASWLRDARPLNAGPLDARPLDARPLDARPLDAGPLDARLLDAGPLDARPRDGDGGDSDGHIHHGQATNAEDPRGVYLIDDSEE